MPRPSLDNAIVRPGVVQGGTAAVAGPGVGRGAGRGGRIRERRGVYIYIIYIYMCRERAKFICTYLCSYIYIIFICEKYWQPLIGITYYETKYCTFWDDTVFVVFC